MYIYVDRIERGNGGNSSKNNIDNETDAEKKSIESVNQVKSITGIKF